MGSNSKMAIEKLKINQKTKIKHKSIHKLKTIKKGP
jgi:hypothetical protein